MNFRQEDIDTSRPGRLGFEGMQDPADPTGEAALPCWVISGDLTRKMKHQPWVAMNIQIALSVLRSPRRIYRGYRKDADEEWEAGYAYVGRPDSYRNEHGDTLPLPPDRLFIVFVRENGDVTEWGKEKCVPQKPDLPLGLDSDPRFKEQVWPTP